ncbi:NAD(P)H-dependent flavin oxidoreductase [Hirschia maritima]|uniref:NAD(P)H-dependent flavin oxidoreductase n=1 Tax=Hirschia maritima TaxID=1121961 RepID=UPI000370F1E8|nr:nitronate monooxygenase family protein [Hirschia maritima]
MPLPDSIQKRLQLPAIASPMFIISNPELVIAQCKAGIVGSFPSLNAREPGQFEQWLIRLNEEITEDDAPYAVNLILHHSNKRLQEDVELCVKYKVPIIITSLGAKEDVFDAIHSYGGIVLHDVINQTFAHKAIDKGADGLILVATGAGGHAGTQSPFALVRETREWFDGPIALSGSIAHGASIAGSIAMGADLAYMGSLFIATEEANAVPAYKQMVADSSAEDILYTNLFTGVHGNYLTPSIVAAGIDPKELHKQEAVKMNFNEMGSDAKAWKDIWGCGQGIGAVKNVRPAKDVIEQLKTEYSEAISKFTN